LSGGASAAEISRTSSTQISGGQKNRTGGALDEVRHSYLVSYSPRGVSQSGWHKLDVRVKCRSVSVKARPGCLAGR
jgi:hypothetical protein